MEGEERGGKGREGEVGGEKGWEGCSPLRVVMPRLRKKVLFLSPPSSTMKQCPRVL